MVESKLWITQTKAAELTGMTLKAVNALVLRKRIKTKEVYGRTLVHRGDIMSYEPKTKNRWSKSTGKGATKKAKGKK